MNQNKFFIHDENLIGEIRAETTLRTAISRADVKMFDRLSTCADLGFVERQSDLVELSSGIIRYMGD